MAEGTPGLSGVQVLPAEMKTPYSTVDSTAAYVDQGVSDVTNQNTVVRHSKYHPPARLMMVEGNYIGATANVNAIPYNNSADSYNNAYSPYHTNTNAYSNNNQYSQQYNSSYYGGAYYGREYNNFSNNSNTFKPPNTYTASSNATSTMEVGDGSVVDSALLAALRDDRERVALLRLEKVMIDFMNAPEGYLEVGGPYNSVVVSPNTSSKRFQSSAAGTDAGGRQTSFHRCLLHRLADRFGIIRENGTILEGSIRLIKQKDSRIPKVLLLHHLEESNKNEVSKGGDTEAITTGVEDLKVAALTAAPPAKDKSKRKMKIMKRNSSADSGNGQAKSAPKSRKNKNFTDKEKAYAEARARIFADEAAAAGIVTGDAHSAPASIATSPSGTPPPEPIDQDNSIYNPYTAAVAAAAATAAPPVHKSVSTNSLNMKRMSSSSLAPEPEEGVTPAAATSGASKATWRNRKEEENDPDFQRGAGLQTLVPVTAAPTYSIPLPGNAYYYQTGVAPSAYGQAYYGDTQHYNISGVPPAGVVRGGRGYVVRGYYPQQQQQHYRSVGNVNSIVEAGNVNCTEEFPALR